MRRTRCNSYVYTSLFVVKIFSSLHSSMRSLSVGVSMCLWGLCAWNYFNSMHANGTDVHNWMWCEDWTICGMERCLSVPVPVPVHDEWHGNDNVSHNARRMHFENASNGFRCRWRLTMTTTATISATPTIRTVGSNPRDINLYDTRHNSKPTHIDSKCLCTTKTARFSLIGKFRLTCARAVAMRIRFEWIPTF